MNQRLRLARLEKQIKSNPAFVRQSPEALRRAEVARRCLPTCTDPEAALILPKRQNGRNLQLAGFSQFEKSSTHTVFASTISDRRLISAEMRVGKSSKGG